MDPLFSSARPVSVPSRFRRGRPFFVALSAAALLSGLFVFVLTPSSILSNGPLSLRTEDSDSSFGYSFFPLLKKDPSRCFSKPDSGPCRASFERYYYDPAEGKCKSFIWGGCQGNVPFRFFAGCVAQNCPAQTPPESETPAPSLPAPSPAVDRLSIQLFYIYNSVYNNSRICIISSTKELTTVNSGPLWPDQVWKLVPSGQGPDTYYIINNHFETYRIALASTTKELFAYNGKIWPDNVWRFEPTGNGNYLIWNNLFTDYRIALNSKYGLFAYNGGMFPDQEWKLIPKL